jgi:hypothetical protein
MRFSIVLVLLLGCGKEPENTPAPSRAPAPKISAAAGGTIGSDARLDIPPGALKEDAAIGITREDRSEPAIHGPVWNITVNGREHYAFNAPVQIHLPYDPSKVSKRVRVVVWENGRWTPALRSTPDPDRKIVTGELDHFSLAAVQEFDPGVKVVSRWRGHTTRVQNFPRADHGGSMESTAHRVTNAFKWAFRVEQDEQSEELRCVAESASWSVHMTEVTLVNGAHRVQKHPEIRAGRSYGEGELSKIVDPYYFLMPDTKKVKVGCTIDFGVTKFSFRERDAFYDGKLHVGEPYPVERQLDISNHHLEGPPHKIEHEVRNGTELTEMWEEPKSKTIKGAVYHRIRKPKDDSDANIDWVEDKMIPVGGIVHVSAWLTEGGPPDYYTKAVDGKFEMTVPDKPVVLELEYVNPDALITERQVVKNGVRKGTVTVRYAMAQKDIDLGEETREDDRYFLGTYIQKAAHLNQNTLDGPVTVDVPKERLISVCPPTRRDDMMARLEHPTRIVFPGYVVCFPTCCTMALRALSLEADHADIAQSAYALVNTRNDPWSFPFPDQSAEWDMYWSFVRYYQANPNSFFAGVLERLDFRLNEAVFGQHWPFVAADAYTRKQWLATVKGTDHRSWQDPTVVKSTLEQKYGARLEIQYKDRDIFTSASSPVVLNRLGAGCVAAVSIDHTSRKREGGRYRKEIGGHILVLLGAVVTAKGEVVRLIFHDPYGDMTQRPADEGYHDPAWIAGGADRINDIDETGRKGAYVPYYPPDIKAWDGRLRSKYWLLFRRPDGTRPPLLKGE